MTRILHGVAAGAAAGAAGTTALNAVTYLDMAWRGRPASRTPEDTVDKLAHLAGVSVPGEGTARDNRLSGLGALTGIVAGVGMGAFLGLARGAGWRGNGGTRAVAATLLALVGTNGPMTALGITDPRTWSRASWVSDIVPHAVYGIVTATVLDRLTEA
jgi:hypothetical protein